MKIIHDKNLNGIIMRDVRFFDATDGLELNDEVKELLNYKLYKNFKEFNERIIKISIRNALMSAQIKKFKAIHSDTQDGITIGFDDLNPKSMIQKLFIVSNDPEIIWKEINLQNPGFFVEVIKQEFGIADGFSKKIQDDFAAQSREY